MKTFILYWHSWAKLQNQEVQGTDIADAIRKLNLRLGEHALIVAYEHNGEKTEVAGQSNCGCVYTAEDGMSCTHDLERIGFSRSELDDRPTPNHLDAYERAIRGE